MSIPSSWSESTLLEKDLEIRKKLRSLTTCAAVHTGVVGGAATFDLVTLGTVTLGSGTALSLGLITKDTVMLFKYNTLYKKVTAEIERRGITHKRRRLGFRGRMSGCVKGLGHAALGTLAEHGIEGMVEPEAGTTT